MNASEGIELDSIFLQELQTVDEDVRRLAALSTFQKLRPSNDITVEQFLTGLQAHKELWAAVSTLGIVEFAEALAGPVGRKAGRPARRPRRPQASAAQVFPGEPSAAQPSQPAATETGAP